MTRDDIIKLAREAGFVHCNPHSAIVIRHSNGSWQSIEERLDQFAVLVARHERKACAEHYLDIMRKAVLEEREACAKVCESLFDMDDDSCSEAEQCAAAIRARSNT